MTPTPFAVVLRFSGLQCSQANLERRLGTAVERYSLDKGGYAQVHIEGEEPDWKTIDDFLQRHGPAVRALCDDREILSACLDLAWNFPEGMALVSYILPARTAALAGSHGIAVEFSAYLEAS